MKKEHVAIIILCFIIAVISVAWFITSRPKDKSWVMVERWEAQSPEQWEDYNLTTDYFLISGTEWCVKWSASSTVASSHFEIEVYDAYTDNVVKEITTEPLAGGNTLGGETYLNDKGRFYLKISICGTVKDWLIYVQQYE